MTDETPAAVADAAERRDVFEPVADGFAVDTTVFDARVHATTAANGWATAFTVTVEVPTLPAAVDGDVGSAVAEGWLDTFERRLADADAATRVAVDHDYAVTVDDETVTVTYEFEHGDAATGLAVAKTVVEYTEGTYVEGVVPGYEYRSPVADLLSEAADGGGDGSRGGTPL